MIDIEAAAQAGIETGVKAEKIKRSVFFLSPSSPPKELVHPRRKEMPPAIENIRDE